MLLIMEGTIKQTRINRNRLDTLYAMTRPDTTAELTYFYHPDHLGSASWITDLSGQPVQHLQYKPFGGDYIDQQDPNTDYTERFRFTGKERDAETGYDYFGARYYSSSLGIWLSVDPMSDKYPSLSPYVYCADNPVNAFDPDGGLPVFLIPLAKGAVGAFVDASAQVSISMINGKSFKEAVGEIDYTSVGAAFVFSAIAAPGASTGAKAATGISKSAKVATKFVTGVAIGVDATTDISANGETSTVFNGGSKSASSFAIDLAATIVPGKVVDNVSSGLSKAIKKDLASNASATLSKEAKASMKHTKDVIDDKGIPGFKGFADFSAGLISGQAKKVIDPQNTKSPSSNRPPMILAPKKNDKAEQSIYRQIIYSKKKRKRLRGNL